MKRKTMLMRDRLDGDLVKLSIYWNDEYIGCIHRQRIKGVVIYLLLDRRDWFVSANETLRDAFSRADNWGFRGRQ